MRWLIALAAAALLWAAPGNSAQAQTNYTYDALGRLKVVAPSSGVQTCYFYDLADNRTKVTASTVCVPTGPQAYDDYIYLTTTGWLYYGYLGVLGNDTDVNLPYDTLTVSSTTGGSYVSISAGDLLFYGSPGSYAFQYTMKDANNATSTAWVYLTIVSCNPDCGLED